MLQISSNFFPCRSSIFVLFSPALRQEHFVEACNGMHSGPLIFCKEVIDLPGFVGERGEQNQSMLEKPTVNTGTLEFDSICWVHLEKKIHTCIFLQLYIQLYTFQKKKKHAWVSQNWVPLKILKFPAETWGICWGPSLGWHSKMDIFKAFF